MRRGNRQSREAQGAGADADDQLIKPIDFLALRDKINVRVERAA